MEKEPEYIKQLRELYKTHTGKELEQALEVTTRSIQNYLKDENPTIPGNNIIVNIREAYAKHIKGESIKKNPDQLDQDLNAKYVALLEAIVKEKTELLKRVDFSLSQLPVDMGKLTDLILRGQELMAEQLRSDIDRKLGALSGKLDAIAANGSHKKTAHKGKH